MRFTEFRTVLTEANLAYGEIRKDYGKYVINLANEISAGNDIIVDPNYVDKFGKTVKIDKDEADRLIQTYFGKIDPREENADVGSVPVEGERNAVIPPDLNSARKIKLKLDGEDRTIGIGAIYKSSAIKGGKGFNTGDVAEGVLGAAVAAKFLALGEIIQEQDIVNVIRSFSSVEEIKSNKRGVTTAKARNDTIIFNLVLNKTSFEALYDSANDNKFPPEILGLLRSGVEYANTDDNVKEAVKTVMDDPSNNEVSINSDGVGDQKGTKADLFLNIDGKVINLLSLKAGDVKQFGQGSGYSYDVLENFFNDTFGIQIDHAHIERMQGDAKSNFEIIKEIYGEMFEQIQSELAGNTNAEVTFLQRLYNGIFYHATRNDPTVSMVILKARPNAPGFAKLTFGEELREAMEQFDLRVSLQQDPPKLQIYGVPVGDDAKKVEGLTGNDLLLQVRSNLKGDTAKGYVRNIVEMGGLLKKIAAVEKMVDKDPQEPATPGSGDDTAVQPKPPVTNDPNQTIPA